MKILKNLNKKVVIIITFLAIMAIGAGIGITLRSSSNDNAIEKPRNNGEHFISEFNDGTFLYSCSKKIKVEYMDSSSGSDGVYRPVSQDEFSKYCRSSGAIEYRAVIDILRRKDVDQLVNKYDQSQVWVRALGHKYIHDKDYLRRILPAYSDTKIDCIIIVHSPEGNRFFIENGEVHKSHDDHQYLEVSSTEFLGSLNKAPDSDINNFWLALH